jgi:putative SOS response-associated peptidase YedK
MCGRFACAISDRVLREQFGLAASASLPTRYNIAPSQPIGAVRGEEAARSLDLMFWGLVPHWAKDKKIGNRPINARAETVAEKPAFGSAFRHRRCLIPASGYYEWQGDKAPKQPYFIAAADGSAMAFAGLWEQWQDAEQTLLSCTIITTDANPALAKIHHRMPVIIAPEDYERWLIEGGKNLLAPCSADRLTARAIGTRVNDPRNDDPELVEPLDDSLNRNV